MSRRYEVIAYARTPTSRKELWRVFSWANTRAVAIRRACAWARRQALPVADFCETRFFPDYRL